jgi:hypothetical protein
MVTAMTELTFNIQSEAIGLVPASDRRLVLEAGETHLAVMLVQVTTSKLIALRYYQFPANGSAGAYKQALQEDPLVNEHGEGPVAIFFHTRESVLVPEALYAGKGGERIVSMIHGDLRPGIALEDSVSGLDIRNLYRIPEEIMASLHQRFPGARFRHVSTALLQVLRDQQGSFPDSYLFMQVYPNMVTVTVMRSRQCQLVQSYPYDIPEDVSYHLLNTTEQLSLDPETVPVKVSGLIDETSPLYLELLKYFRHLDTFPATACLDLDQTFEAYPAHFFTPQTILGSCA